MKNKDEMPDYSGVIEMTKNMEIVENFLRRRGRFVGDMVHISIADLAENVQRLEAEKAELVKCLNFAMNTFRDIGFTEYSVIITEMLEKNGG